MGAPMQLRYVKRFSTCRVLHPESVAEHSYYTALYALFICHYLKQHKSWVVDEGLLLRRALLHDFEESRTGDIIRTFKRSNEVLESAIEVGASDAMDDILKKLFKSRTLQEFFYVEWGEAKDQTVEGRIVKFADFLSVVSYMCEELRSANATMREHVLCMREYIELFDSAEYAFLGDLLEQAREVCNEFIFVDETV